MTTQRRLKSVFFSIWLVAVVAILAHTQTLLDLKSQSQDADFSAFPSTKPLQVGTLLPATCNQGQLFFKSDATAGQNVYGCTGPNIWTLEGAGGGGGGAGTIAVSAGGVLVGTRADLDFTPGSGTTAAISDTGSEILIQESYDTSVLLSKATARSGAPLLCGSASASTTVYTCAMSPILTAYTSGMILNWVPDLGCGTAATLNVDILGAVAVVHKDGTTATSSGDCPAGQLKQIWYDGTSFRLLN